MLEEKDRVEAADGSGAPCDPSAEGERDPVVALLARFPLGRPFSAEEAADYAEAAQPKASHEDVLAKVRARFGT